MQVIGLPQDAMTTHLDQITQSLRERILSGAYASNDRLAETALAESLGGSRTLIRLALSVLEQESLVRREPNRGFRVRGYSLDEVTDAIAVRGELEAMAARLAAESGLEPGTAQSLRIVVEEMDGILAQGFESLLSRTRWIELNGLFHRDIIAASGNAAIAEAVAQLSRRPLVSSHAIVFDQTDPARSKVQIKIAHDDHHAILDAIVNRQGDRAAARMREHALGSGRNKRANIDAMKRGTLVPKPPGVNLVAP
jgi:GntR family transcriptional regulator of vanillate catabolism